MKRVPPFINPRKDNKVLERVLIIILEHNFRILRI